MIDMALEPSKETGNKLRWSVYVEDDGARFHLYIPKWRVPEPWPGRIRVQISAWDGDRSLLEPGPFSQGRLEDPIKLVVCQEAEHTRTMRYAPLGDEKSWQIGKPYIPCSLLPADSDVLVLEVRWDLNSRGQFFGVPTYRREVRRP